VCVVAPDGRLLMVNAAFESIFGYRPDEVVGRQRLERVHLHERAAAGQAARNVGRPRAAQLPQPLSVPRSVVAIQWSARWLPEYGIRISAGHELTALLTGCGDSAFVLDIVTLLRARFRPWPDPAKGTNTG